MTAFGTSAERLHDALGHALNRGVRIQMIEEAFAAERLAARHDLSSALVWNYSGPCPVCGNIIDADLPNIQASKVQE